MTCFLKSLNRANVAKRTSLQYRRRDSSPLVPGLSDPPRKKRKSKVSVENTPASAADKSSSAEDALISTSAVNKSSSAEDALISASAADKSLLKTRQ